MVDGGRKQKDKKNDEHEIKQGNTSGRRKQ